MEYKKVPIEVYEHLVMVQGHSFINKNLMVIPCLRDIKKLELNQKKGRVNGKE